MDPDESMPVVVACEPGADLPHNLLGAIREQVQKMSVDTGIGVRELQIIVRGAEDDKDEERNEAMLQSTGQELTFVMNVASNDEAGNVQVIQLPSSTENPSVPQEKDINIKGKRGRGRPPKKRKSQEAMRGTGPEGGVEGVGSIIKSEGEESNRQITPVKKRGRRPKSEMNIQSVVSGDVASDVNIEHDAVGLSRRSGRTLKPKVFFDGSRSNVISRVETVKMELVSKSKPKSKNNTEIEISVNKGGKGRSQKAEGAEQRKKDNDNLEKTVNVLPTAKKRGRPRKDTKVINISSESNERNVKSSDDVCEMAEKNNSDDVSPTKTEVLQKQTVGRVHNSENVDGISEIMDIFECENYSYVDKAKNTKNVENNDDLDDHVDDFQSKKPKKKIKSVNIVTKDCIKTCVTNKSDLNHKSKDQVSRDSCAQNVDNDNESEMDVSDETMTCNKCNSVLCVAEYKAHIKACKIDAISICDICGEEVKVSALKKHKRKCHVDEVDQAKDEQGNVKSNYVCPECGKVLQTRSGLCTHRRIHRNLKDHVCNYCGKKFTQRGNLHKHISSVHQFMKPYLCSHCGASFTQQAGLDYHMRAHRHNERMREIGQLTNLGCDLEGTDKTQVRCLFCSEIFINVLRYLHHLKDHLSKKASDGENLNLDEGKRSLAQTILEKQETLLKKEKVYKCDKCDKIFWVRGMLNEHLQTHLNADGQQYKCKYCDEIFGSSSTRNNHQRIHTDMYQFACEECDKRFVHQYQLKHHTSVYHDSTGNGIPKRMLKGNVVKPKQTFSCTQCNKEFGSVYNMKVHMRTHKKERPFQCIVCKNTFTDPSNLIAHGKRHHPNHRRELFTSSIKKLRQLKHEGVIENGEVIGEPVKSDESQTEAIAEGSQSQTQELVQEISLVPVDDTGENMEQPMLKTEQPESDEDKVNEVALEASNNLFLIPNNPVAILQKPDEGEDNLTLVEYQIGWI